jgi:hypothetical protein
MVKGYFNDVALVDDYLNLVESEELSDLCQGRENPNIPKAIKFEVGLTQSYLKFFLNNFNCEMFSDLKDMLENFDTLEYYDTLIKEYERLQTRLEENACKFVDKCYKTPELKRYSKIMDKTQKEGKYPLFNLCKTYIELRQANGKGLVGESLEQDEEEFGSGKVHEFFKKIATYLGDNSQAFEENCITEKEIYEHFEGLVDERFDHVWGEEAEESEEQVDYMLPPRKFLPEREKE